MSKHACTKIRSSYLKTADKLFIIVCFSETMNFLEISHGSDNLHQFNFTALVHNFNYSSYLTCLFGDDLQYLYLSAKDWLMAQSVP